MVQSKQTKTKIFDFEIPDWWSYSPIYLLVKNLTARAETEKAKILLRTYQKQTAMKYTLFYSGGFVLLLIRIFLTQVQGFTSPYNPSNRQ